MKRSLLFSRLKYSVLLVAFFLSITSAHASDPACAQLMAAMQKLAITPNHQFMIRTAAFDKGQKLSEVIITDTTMYLQVAGKWQSRPYDPKKSVQDLTAVGDTPGLTCLVASDETIDGQSASLIRSQQRQEDGDTVDGQMWISKSTGLPLRQIIDMDVGGTLGKSHMKERFEYTQVQAPSLK